MTTQSVGRKTVMTEATVQKLEQALRDGFSVGMACYTSGVSRSTYYNHLATNSDFMDKMTLAQAYPTERAKQVVVQAINNKDLRAAQWWLERKARAEFNPNQPPTPQRNNNVDFVDQYFGGNQEKYLDFMSQTIKALREPPRAS